MLILSTGNSASLSCFLWLVMGTDYYRDVRISGVSFKRGSTVLPFVFLHCSYNLLVVEHDHLLSAEDDHVSRIRLANYSRHIRF